MLQDPLLCTADLLWASGALSRFGDPLREPKALPYCMTHVVLVTVPSWGQGPRYT